MTAEEIRALVKKKPDQITNLQNVLLAEVAAQLAEFNERQRNSPAGTLEQPIFLREAKP